MINKGLCLTVLTTALFVSACGGGGGEDGDVPPNAGPPGGSIPVVPGVPPASTTVFTPAADDLPTAIQVDYPDQTTALRVAANYQPTNAPGSGPYLNYSTGQCSDATPSTQAYPSGRVTLKTLNRTRVATGDDCLPEQKIDVSSTSALFTGGNADMRVRGSSTRGAAQKSFRIRTKKDSVTGVRPAMWYGEDTLQLNKHPYDLTRVRNKLAFDLMKQIPHHQSMRTQFFEVVYSDIVNTPSDAGPVGSLGLFTHIEKFSERYLTLRGWQVANAQVYKAASFNFNRKSAYACNPDGTANAALEAALEHEVGDGRSCPSIIAMMDALSNTGVPFADTFDQYFNRNNYLTWLAGVILLGNYDTTTQNFALYQNPANGKFYFLPWDYDAALDYSRQINALGYADWSYGLGNWWDSALHRRFIMEPGNVELLKAAVTEIYSRYLTKDAVRSLLDTYKPTVRNFVTSSPDKDNLLGTELQWEAEYSRLVDTIEKNYNQFLDSLKRPMPFWFTVVGNQGDPITELRWSWPSAFHPQGHAITYEAEFLPFDPTDTALPAGQTAFDVPGVRTVLRRSTGASPSLLAAQFPSGAHWVRVQAKDLTNNTSTYAFDEVYDTRTRHGVMCKVLPLNTNCPGVQ
ncbi:MAG TPA: CotH kinase family protein [Burkholderiaceae bacterium]|nr:CotH kinase family protein [Burkholderiaceae bacterium]